jgi:hypothetical protein
METRIDAGADWKDEIARLERDGVAAFLIIRHAKVVGRDR